MEKMFCPSCGTQIPHDSVFCLKCGRSMAVPPNESSAATPTPGLVRRVSLAHVVLGFLLAAVLAATLNGLRRSTAATGKTEAGLTTQTPADVLTKSQVPQPSTPTAPVKLSAGEIAAKYADAVVVLESYNDLGQEVGQGSGFIFESSGRVFTNYHVIRGVSRVTARLRDQSTHEVEYILGFDMTHDVAALKLDGEGVPAVHLGSPASVKAGDHVTVLGAPLGLESTLSDGIISAVRESGGSRRLFQTSAPISHGSSGGPLFDDYGRVIGLAVAIVEAGENLNFAVPIDFGTALLKEEHRIGFSEMLSMTAVHQPIISSSMSIPAQVVGIDVMVPQQGGVLAGSFSISGGFGNDLGVSLASASGGSIWSGGVVQNYANLNVPLRGGRYKLILNNKVGPLWVSPKTVSGTVALNYYR
jgi:hypothetical protein